MRGHPRRRGEPLAPARRLGDGDDLGPAGGQLRGDRQQERARRRPAGRGGRAARPGPWPAPARRRRSSRPAASSPGRRPGGRRRRSPEHDRPRADPRGAVAGEQQHAGLGHAPDRAAGEQLGAGSVEVGDARARRGRERARSGRPTSSKRRRQICPPGAAYSSISTTDAPARRAATAAAIPAGPPPTIATSTCVSSLIGTSVRALRGPTYRQLSKVGGPPFVRDAGSLGAAIDRSSPHE